MHHPMMRRRPQGTTFAGSVLMRRTIDDNARWQGGGMHIKSMEGSGAPSHLCASLHRFSDTRAFPLSFAFSAALLTAGAGLQSRMPYLPSASLSA